MGPKRSCRVCKCCYSLPTVCSDFQLGVHFPLMFVKTNQPKKLNGLPAGRSEGREREGTGWDAEVESAYSNLCQFGEESALSFLLYRREMLVSFGNSVANLPGAEMKGNKSFLFLFNTSTLVLFCSLSKIHFKLVFNTKLTYSLLILKIVEFH